MVRALFRSVEMTGQPSLSLKIYYPALYSGSHQERNTGMLPADMSQGARPLAILMPGINVSPDSYAWLASTLVERGFVAVLYGWILEEMPGLTALTPGLDVSALKPDSYGSRPSATALTALLDKLQQENTSGQLAGLLDLDRILLGGHSAGGSVALFNARPDWFPGLKAVFSYAAHAKASTMLGYAEDTVLSLPTALPCLIIGGSEDGVIAASAFRYGADDSQRADPVGPLRRSFEEGLQRNQGDSHLAILRGANHFSLSWPADAATGRPFLDQPETRANAELRAELAALIGDFAAAHVQQAPGAAAQLQQRLNNADEYSRSLTR